MTICFVCVIVLLNGSVLFRGSIHSIKNSVKSLLEDDIFEKLRIFLMTSLISITYIVVERIAYIPSQDQELIFILYGLNCIERV